MNIMNILNMIGGLSLFLYGMNVMGNGLSKMAGGRLEKILEKLTTKRFLAVLLGAGVTAVIQSSSATTVMVVGFVNSGIMKLNQAVGIIMGANIGTTMTSWILSLTSIDGNTIWLKLLKPSSFSPILAAIGVVLTMISKQESKKKDVGNILIGFAILMFGMETMSSSVSGLANNTMFTNLMTTFQNPVLGMAMGAILTAIIQSSSASVGILQALCTTGAVHYSMAIPIIMGQNIGTCITSILSSISANKNAKRAAMVHLYFNLIGTILFMVVFYSLNVFLDFGFLTQSANASGIALIHSLFNIGATIVLYPFSNQLVKLAQITIKDASSQHESELVSIDERFLSRPAFAMEVCRSKAIEMAKLSKTSIQLALEVLISYDQQKAKEVIRLESVVDQYEDALGSYLVKISCKNISKEDSQSMALILHSISDFERISDHAMEIVKSARQIHDNNLSFTQYGKMEIETLNHAIDDICQLTVNCFCEGDNLMAKRVEPLEEVIDTLCKTIKENHVNRLQNGTCSIEMGFILDNILNDLERVSDHCSNVAIEMITIYDNAHSAHEYYNNLTSDERDEFNKEYSQRLNQYPLIKESDMMLE